jgi:hypothetical protein
VKLYGDALNQVKEAFDWSNFMWVFTPEPHSVGRHSLTCVPELATMLLFGCGLIGLVAVGRKKFQQGNIE